MIACNYLYLVIVGFAVLGWGSLAYAEGDVTVVSAPGGAATTPAPKTTVAADGTPVVHKSSHKKKNKDATTASSATTPANATTASMTAAASSATASGTATTSLSAPKPVKASRDATAATAKTASATSDTTAAPKTASTSNTAIPKSMAKSSAKTSATASTSTHVKSGAANSTTAQTSTPAPVKSVSSSTARALPSSSGAAVPAATGPTVETGVLPIAKHSSADAGLNAAPIPTGVTMQNPGTTYHTSLAGIFPPVSPISGISPTRALSSYVEANRTSSPSNDFVFTNFYKGKNVYPWKTNIVTTKFWIGEGGSAISSTTNLASSWDEEWVSSNHGSDSPDDRNGYASGNHASTVNPFYIALPFNDLAFPEKAREYLPAGWYRRPKDGKQVSACQHRWIEIKNAQGRVCYAQWEDVGPLRFDDAEYVFGNERPTSAYSHAGLDVSPAVADYLAINETGVTSWRFVNDEDVPPGQWLKYDEQAVIYTALHQLKNSTPSSIAPIQKTSEPTDDTDDSNKKRVGAAKG